MASNNGEQRPQNVAADFIAKLKQLPKWLLVAFTFVILACAAVIDFLTGYEISCAVFYLVAAGLATWYVGPSFGILSAFFLPQIRFYKLTKSINVPSRYQ